MRISLGCLFAVIAVALLTCLPIPQRTFAVELAGGWYDIQSPTNANLWSVDVISTSDGWAVGAGGVIIRWNGGLWSIVRSPTSNTLYSVDMVSTNEGWAVGGSGTIVRWNGVSWIAYVSPTTTDLYSVDMINAKDGWAVGASGTVIRWDGSTWTIISDPDIPSNDLYCVDVVYVGMLYDVWAVGADGTIIRDLDVTGVVDFQKVDSPLPGVDLQSVDMSRRIHGWFVGKTHLVSGNWKTTILELSGLSWRVVDTGPSGFVDLYSVDMGDGVPSSVGWAVGDVGTVFYRELGYLPRDWSWYNPTGGILHDIDVVSDDDVWAVGTYGTIIHYTIARSELAKGIEHLQNRLDGIETRIDEMEAGIEALDARLQQIIQNLPRGWNVEWMLLSVSIFAVATVAVVACWKRRG